MPRPQTPASPCFEGPFLATAAVVAGLIAMPVPSAAQDTPEASFMVELDVRGARGGVLEGRQVYEAFEIKVRYVEPPQEALNSRRAGPELVRGQFVDSPRRGAERPSVFLAAYEVQDGKIVSGSRSAAFDVVTGETRRVDPRLLSNSEVLSRLLGSEGDGNVSVVQARGAVLMAPSVGSGTFWSRTAAGSGETWIASPISWLPSVGSGTFWSSLPRDWASRDGVYLIALPADSELQPHALSQPVLLLAGGHE